MKNVISRTTRIANGIYGPSHVPYAYTEYKMATKYSDDTEVSVVVHVGLLVWCEVNGADRVKFYEDDDYSNWVIPAGITLDDFILAVQAAQARRKERCPKCDSRKMTGRAGYPGEYICLCADCGAFVYADFDISAVA